MEISQTLRLLRERPGLLGLDDSYGQAVAFVQGIDAAQDGGLLAGFHEWLVVRVDGGANLAWPALIARIAFPGRHPSNAAEPLTADENRHAIDVLCTCVTEFMTDRLSGDGLIRIYDRYIRWLRAQEWYGPSSPSYLDIND